MKKYRLLLFCLFISSFILGNAKRPNTYWLVPTVNLPSEYRYFPANQKVFIDMVKGEAEHIQVVLKTTKGEVIKIEQAKSIKDIQTHFRELKNINGYPDALVPLKDEIVCTDSLTTIWITYQSGYHTKVKKTRDILQIKSTDQSHRIEVQLQIHDIELPIKSSIPIVAGVEIDKITEGLGKEASDAAKEKWVNFILDYRISPMFGSRLSAERWNYDRSFSPWPWNDGRSLKLLDDKRYAAFVLPYFTLDHNGLTSMLDCLSQKEKLDDSFFYIWDEPAYIEDYQAIKAKADSIHTINPQAKVMTTFFCAPRNGSRQGDLYAIYEELKEEIQIFAMSLAPHKGNEESVQAARNKVPDGIAWWSYICWEPIGSEPNFLLEMKGMQQRAIMWRTWKNRSEGFLYWDTNVYHQRHPFTYITDMPHGDGILIYPGELFGIDGPVASARLERWRDGAEEAELLYMLRHKGLEKEAREILETVYKDPTHYSNQASLLPEFKSRLIDKVEQQRAN